MSKLYFEDFIPGSVTEYGPYMLTAEEIIAFGKEFDPQSMHVDPEAARHTMVGGLCASGWHGCGIMMRIMVDGFIGNSSSMGAPGVDEVRWLSPIRPGPLKLRARALEARASNSKPDRGFVKFTMELLDGEGRCVMELTSSLMFARRSPSAA